MYHTIQTNSDNPDFQILVKLLDADLYSRYGEQQAFFDQFNTTADIKHVIVLYADDEPVGCGAIKQYDAETMEVKRVYVKHEYRGKKLGLKIMQELEAWAKILGYNTCILETAKSQPEAIKLYLNNSYDITENYGQYVGVEISVCMRKDLE